MGLIVQKFGGTSVGSIERIRHVAQLVKQEVEQGNQLVVVVSAMGKSTDQLVEMAGQISAHPSPREMDMLLTTGEQVSIALLSMALAELGVEAISFTGWQAGIETEKVHQKARITHIDPDKIRNHLHQGRVAVVAGFQGVTPDGEITTLGRGGSDTTAVALAAALQADRCDIYTDVRGIYTADPRVVPTASQLKEISYDEMLELATLGAGVLHPRAVECAKNYGVKLIVRSSFEAVPGTEVKEDVDMETGRVVHGVAHDDRVTKVTLKGLPNEIGILSRVFNLLAEHHLNVDIIINQSIKGERQTNISFSLDTQDLDQALRVLEEHRSQLGFEEVIYERDMAKVSIVGAGMISNPGVAAQMFQSLAEAGIEIKMVSTSEIKVSCIVPRQDMERAVLTLHTAFGLDRVEEHVTTSN
jgi:aspartate kinase